MTRRKITRQISKHTAGPVVPGAAFMTAYQTGQGAAFLYDTVKNLHDAPAVFSAVKVALAELADRIAWRLVMAGEPAATGSSAVASVSYPDLHRIETTALLALIFVEAPTATYDRSAPGATFWNWWDWTAGNETRDPSDKRLTDLPRAERLAAGAAAMAVLNARAATQVAC